MRASCLDHRGQADQRRQRRRARPAASARRAAGNARPPAPESARASPIAATTARYGIAVMKCFTPPKIGVDGTASTASGPSVCTSQERARRPVDVFAGAEPARLRRRRRRAPRAVPPGATGSPRRRRASTIAPTAASASVVTGTVNPVSTNGAGRTNQLARRGRRRVVPVEAEVLEVVVLVLQVAVDVCARPRHRRRSTATASARRR